MNEAWHEKRRKGIGGTDVAAIMGINQYKTALDVYRQKTEKLEPTPMNKAMAMGIRLEPMIAQWVAEDEALLKITKAKGFIMDPAHPFLLANIDRFVEIDPKNPHPLIPFVGKGVMEIKTVRSSAFRRWQQAVPEIYFCQMMHYIHITKSEWGLFVVYVKDADDYHFVPFPRDDEWIGKQVLACVDFWKNHVEKRIPPPEVAKDLDYSLSTASHIEATVEITETYSALKTLNAEMKDKESQKEELENEIKEYMHENEMMTVLGRPAVSYKSYEGRKTIDVKKLQVEKPKIYEEYLREGKPYRKFTLIDRDEEMM